MAAKHYLYRNLHSDTFSLLYKGIVVSRPVYVELRGVELKVSEPGRQRVIKEKRKNVHAKCGADIAIVCTGTPNLNGFTEVYYDPYTTSNFVIKSTGKPLFHADLIIGFENKIYIRESELTHTDMIGIATQETLAL